MPLRTTICRSVCATLLVVCFSTISQGQATIEISLKQGTQSEAATKQQLEKLLRTYDLSPWIFTKFIIIDEKAIPHSHPVLTLSTRHLRDDELLLSTLIHEQLHWFLVQRQKDTDAAIKELRVMFPTVPDRPPEGAQDEQSTYLHLLVCYLEYRADQQLLGELKARQVMDFWAPITTHGSTRRFGATTRSCGYHRQIQAAARRCATNQPMIREDRESPCRE